MIKLLKTMIFSIVLIIIQLIYLNAAEEESSTVLQFLTISPSPEALSLGNAYLSSTGKADAFYYNPSSTSFGDTASLQPDAKYQYSFIKGLDISLSYIKYFQSLHYGSLFTSLQLKNLGSAGFGIISLFYDDIIRIEDDTLGGYRLTDEKIDLGDYCFLLNYALRIKNDIGVGFNLKYITEKLDTKTGSSICGDIGILYKQKRGAAGFVLQNIGKPVTFDRERENLPLTFIIGGDYNIKIKKLLLTEKDHIKLSSSIKKGIETVFIFNSGIEYSIKEFIFIRAGYQINGNDDGIKAGAGFKYKNFDINYSINNYENLGIIHRVGLNGHFEFRDKLPDEEQKRAEAAELFQETQLGLEAMIDNNILFEPGTVKIKKDAYPVLENIYIFLKQYKEEKIVIQCSNMEDPAQKDPIIRLSEKRAEALNQYFIRQGIDPDQLQVWVRIFYFHKDEQQKKQETNIIVLKKDSGEGIIRLIKKLPDREKKKAEELFYFGLDSYYKEDKAGAVKIWIKIKTSNEKLNKLIHEKIDQVKKEIEE
ncbi:MAG: PorV/PorQ family protein [Spirochaetes bacterium]|nr:PorV/PorQ family protein [Spirochaetota bacterium]